MTDLITQRSRAWPEKERKGQLVTMASHLEDVLYPRNSMESQGDRDPTPQKFCKDTRSILPDSNSGPLGGGLAFIYYTILSRAAAEFISTAPWKAGYVREEH